MNFRDIENSRLVDGEKIDNLPVDIDWSLSTLQGEVDLNTAKNSYPSVDASKLAWIEAWAEVNVVGEAPEDWSQYARKDGWWEEVSWGGGGWAVDSVNGETGVVVLDTSDIDATTDRNYVTDAEATIIGNTSWTNTWDQTITLTGDVTGTGTGSFATTITDDSVDFDKIQNIATNRVLARSTAGTGSVEDLTLPNFRTLINVEDWADVTDATNVEAAWAVMNTWDETIAGVKTFSSSPIIPAPTTDLQAATKKYVDDNSGVTLTNTVTLTNKRITERTNTITSSATPTPAWDTTDVFTVTALAADAAFAAPTGTPTNWQVLLIRIKDNATARALTWNAIYRASTDLALPTTTVISKTLYLQFVYNSTDSKWDLLGLLNNI